MRGERTHGMLPGARVGWLAAIVALGLVVWLARSDGPEGLTPQSAPDPVHQVSAPTLAGRAAPDQAALVTTPIEGASGPVDDVRARQIAGSAVDISGAGVAHAAVAVRHVGMPIAEGSTQASGTFSVSASEHIAGPTAVEPTLSITTSEGGFGACAVGGWRAGAAARTDVDVGRVRVVRGGRLRIELIGGDELADAVRVSIHLPSSAVEGAVSERYQRHAASRAAAGAPDGEAWSTRIMSSSHRPAL